MPSSFHFNQQRLCMYKGKGAQTCKDRKDYNLLANGVFQFKWISLGKQVMIFMSKKVTFQHPGNATFAKFC